MTEKTHCMKSMRSFPGEYKCDGSYCVVAVSWLETWRQFMDNKTKEKPPLIDLSFLLCPHNQICLSPNPSHEFYKSSGVGIEIDCIPSQEFDILQTRYGGEHRVVVQLESYGYGSKKETTYLPMPEVCEECFREEVNKTLQRELNFEKKKLFFVKIREGSTMHLKSTEIECSHDWTLGRIRNDLFPIMEISPLEQTFWYKERFGFLFCFVCFVCFVFFRFFFCEN